MASMEHSNKTRQYSGLDHLISGVDQALRTVFGNPQSTERSDPAADLSKDHLNEKQLIDLAFY